MVIPVLGRGAQEDIGPVSGDTAFGGCQLIKTAKEPAVQTGHVLPEPRKGGPLFVRPACAFRHAVQDRCRGTELYGMKSTDCLSPK
jgi:hypothetical protein